jgi:hypothetical protein
MFLLLQDVSIMLVQPLFVHNLCSVISKTSVTQPLLAESSAVPRRPRLLYCRVHLQWNILYFYMQTLQIISNDALRSSIQSVHKPVLTYWQSYEHYEMQLYVFRSWVVQGRIITPDFWISVDKKIVSVGKEHTTYVIFLINSWEFPHVEIFFDVNISGNNSSN